MAISAIATLKDFYELMHGTRPLRRGLVKKLLAGGAAAADEIAALRAALATLENIPRAGAGYRVAIDGQKNITIDLSYEIGELRKDIIFLTEGEQALYAYLAELQPGLMDDVARGMELLQGRKFNMFATDRDGTVNNYCGRYNSSVQSVYNALFLTRFAQRCARDAIILTSASLDDVGLLDMSVIPEGACILAGSKGREYTDLTGRRRGLAVPARQQAKLNELNDRIRALVRQPGYGIHALIGSGVQFKFGQTTVARQDISGSVTDEASQAFLKVLEGIVAEVDPRGDYFRIEDTGKDVEILLTIDTDGAEKKDFDKGDGLTFLASELGLDMTRGPNLICGDTGSDVPMLTASLNATPDSWAVFVTGDEGLATRVTGECANSLIVAVPDALVVLLHELAKYAVDVKIPDRDGRA